MSRKRKNFVAFWLNEKELIQLKDKISKTSLTRSDYLRKCSLNKNIAVMPGIRDLVIEIKRIGNNLNQLTHAVNHGTLTVLGNDFKVIKEDLKKVWDRLAAVLKKI